MIRIIYPKLIKSFFDIGFALIFFLISSPVFLLIMLLLFIVNNGNPFFFQSRGGKNQSVFNVIKFKTMNDKKDVTGKLLPDEQRLTKIGGFIRKTSLDELPQLINVIKRDMSLVGPRPLMSEYLELYNDFQNRRHEAMPGISGWAQVNGRNNLSWSQKFDLDVWYVDNISFFLDIRILFMTVVKIFKVSEINEPGYVSSALFNGKN